MASSAKKPIELLTVGHSTLELDVFVRALRECGVEQVVDIRTIPRCAATTTRHAVCALCFLRCLLAPRRCWPSWCYVAVVCSLFLSRTQQEESTTTMDLYHHGMLRIVGGAPW